MKDLTPQIQQMIENSLLLYHYKDKKAKALIQLYSVNLARTIKIGGLNEVGYNLNFYINGTRSNVCITQLDILRLLHGDKLENSQFNISIIELKEKKAINPICWGKN